MPARCRVCGKSAVVRIPYTRMWLCSDHLAAYLEKRVGETVDRYHLLSRGDRVLVMVSGGKDSASMASILSALASKKGFEAALLHIDLGVGEFSALSRAAAEELSKRINLPLLVVPLREAIGADLPRLIKSVRRRSPCATCGVVKRYVANVAALRIGFDAVAVGHTLVDLASFALKGYITRSEEPLEAATPKNPGLSGLFVDRIKPLAEVGEVETRAYVKYAEIPWTDAVCEYKPVRTIDVEIRDFVSKLERDYPSLLVSMMRGVYARAPKTQREGVGKCSVCEAPTNTDVCAFCRITSRALGESGAPALHEFLEEKREVLA